MDKIKCLICNNIEILCNGIKHETSSACAMTTYLLQHTKCMEIKIKKMSSFKSNKNIHKKEDGSYYVLSANKASSVTL